MRASIRNHIPYCSCQIMTTTTTGMVTIREATPPTPTMMIIMVAAMTTIMTMDMEPHLDPGNRSVEPALDQRGWVMLLESCPR